MDGVNLEKKYVKFNFRYMNPLTKVAINRRQFSNFIIILLNTTFQLHYMKIM